MTLYQQAMISAATETQPPETLSPSQKAALICLLGDEDPAVTGWCGKRFFPADRRRWDGCVRTH